MCGVIKLITAKMTFCRIRKNKKSPFEEFEKFEKLKTFECLDLWQSFPHNIFRLLGVIATHYPGVIGTPHSGVITTPPVPYR